MIAYNAPSDGATQLIFALCAAGYALLLLAHITKDR